MAKSFDEILTSMLEQLENNPDQDIEVLVKDECERMGVSEEGKALLSETNEYIDGFAERMASLGAPDKPCGEDARMLTQNCR